MAGQRQLNNDGPQRLPIFLDHVVLNSSALFGSSTQIMHESPFPSTGFDMLCVQEINSAREVHMSERMFVLVECKYFLEFAQTIEYFLWPTNVFDYKRPLSVTAIV